MALCVVQFFNDKQKIRDENKETTNGEEPKNEVAIW